MILSEIQLKIEPKKMPNAFYIPYYTLTLRFPLKKKKKNNRY